VRSDLAILHLILLVMECQLGLNLISPLPRFLQYEASVLHRNFLLLFLEPEVAFI
jgi:hypothetical protein